jgi:HSP20 family protein
MERLPWKPFFGPLADLRREMDRVFESFLGRGKGKEAPDLLSPAVDLEETDKEIVVKAELPGIDPGDIDVELSGSNLIIRGEKKIEKEEKKKNYHLMERSYGSFFRSIPLPVEVKEKEIKANYKKGVLEISLPKAEVALPKKIKVNLKET